VPAVLSPPINLEGSMDKVAEEQCSICSTWPAAEGPERRHEPFGTDYIRAPDAFRPTLDA
jgi:hypothetical protein